MKVQCLNNSNDTSSGIRHLFKWEYKEEPHQRSKTILRVLTIMKF